MQRLLEACAETSAYLAQARDPRPVSRRLRSDARLRSLADGIASQLDGGFQVHSVPDTFPLKSGRWKAVTWNIERGKKFRALARSLHEDPRLNDADFYLLTEVDWGMARSENRNVAAELGKELGLNAYFTPSYFNFTLGHGAERESKGHNQLGLHGKAILSRYPLENLRVIRLCHATDKLKSKETKLGEKRALVADCPLGHQRLTLACTHLDAFSSPRARAEKLGRTLEILRGTRQALVAGDWNTNTLDTSHGPSLFWSVLKQVLLTGPQGMIRGHFPTPERKFDRPLFRKLEAAGFTFRDFNEAGVGTYDLLFNDRDLGDMARDRFPTWILRWINRQIQKGGGKISLKLDWFAGKNLNPIRRQVVPLQEGRDYPAGDRPSDHHPVALEFDLPTEDLR